MYAGGILVSSAYTQERSLLAKAEAAASVLQGCGPAPDYAHAHPQNVADARKTFFNATSKQTEEIRFAVGQNITFACQSGFTVNGAKAGQTTFVAECTQHG